MIIHKPSMIVYRTNHNHDAKCHFCKTNQVEDELKVHIIEEANHTEYLIRVPRCDKCINRHKTKKRFSVLSIISSLLCYIMLVGSAATISGVTAGVAAFLGLGLAILIYYICHLLEEEIINGGYDATNKRIELDELKLLYDSDYRVNARREETKDDIYYCVKQLPKEFLDALETEYHYVKSEA